MYRRKFQCVISHLNPSFGLKGIVFYLFQCGAGQAACILFKAAVFRHNAGADICFCAHPSCFCTDRARIRRQNEVINIAAGGSKKAFLDALEGVCIIAGADKHKIIATVRCNTNRAFERMHGESKAGIIGKQLQAVSAAEDENH